MYGNLGVIFFFILSGYFIIGSLERSDSAASFLKKKFLRLWPGLILGSILIFCICNIIDFENIMPQWHNWQNLLGSITFISPNLLHKFGWEVEYINGSYWFLWVEVQFLILTAIVYSFGKRNVRRNLFILCAIGYMMFYGLERIIANVQTTNRLGLYISGTTIQEFNDWFAICNVFRYCLFFMIGIVLYFIQNIHEKRVVKAIYVILTILLLLCDTWRWTSIQYTWIMLIVLLISLSVFLSGKVWEQDWHHLATLGAGSYFVYIIHEPIGVLLINDSNNFIANATMMKLFPIFILCAFLLLGVLFNRFIESPIVKYLSR